MRQFAGTHLDGSFTVAEATLNELLRMSPEPWSGCELVIAAGNAVVVRYGMLHATATIQAVETRPAPRLRLTLASFAVALAARAALRQPYVRISGRDVTIDLGAVPALQPYARLWPHFQRVAIATTAGRLRVEVVIAVEE